MDLESTLRRLCRRYGVPLASARRLAPILQRAARASGEVRRNLMAVVEATLAREAEEIARRDQMERQALLAIANVLHDWQAG